MDLTEQTHAGEVALNYVEGPANGPAVLFLHGTIARWQGWRPVLPLIGQRAHVFALDDRGYGKSDRSADGRYRYLDFASDAERFIREAIGEPTVVIGHSRGAMVAVALAVAADDMIRGLILQEPTLRKPSSADGAPPANPRPSRLRDLLASGATVEELAQELLVREPTQPEAEARDRAENVSHMDVRAYDAIQSGNVRDGYDEWTLLKELRCPVAFVLGDPEGGTMVEDSLITEARRLIADSRVVSIPGARHRVHLSHPEEFSSACLTFIQTLSD